MAGGVGSRFWPMSTEERPKQFIDVLGTGKTLLQLTVERFGQLVDPENIWVVTNEKYADIVKLATRRHADPEAIIRAYATYSYDGDMTKITDPFFDFPFSIDNAALGASPLWPEVRNCPNTHDCWRCGKCDALLEELKAKSAHKEGVSTTTAFVKFFKG